MKPKKRPNKLREQRHAAREEIQRIGIKPPASTFPRQTTPSDYALRRLQKRRINAKTVEKMLQSKDPVLKQTAVERITGKKIRKHLNTTPLEKLAEHPDLWIREQAAKALAKRYAEQKNIPELKKLTEHPEPFVRWEAANVLAQTHAKKGNIAELKKLTEHPEPYVRTEAKNALAQMKAKKIMLGTRRPFAATAHLPEILKKTQALNAVASQLRKEFGQSFIGIVVFGSTAKGYARPKSDVDYAVIASDQKAAERFREISEQKGLPLCHEHYVNPNTQKTNKAPLFNGLFFGNRKALTQAQKTAFQQISQKEWNRIRTQIHENERQLGKAFKQYNISPREQQRIRVAAALRVPPPYSEMKKLLGIK